MPKMHECELCGASFARGHDLRRHQKIHTNDRPYKCTICNKRYIQKSHLKNHMNTHTGEKPHGCTMCTCAFGDPGSLTRHKKAVHEYEPPRDRKKRNKVPVVVQPFKKPYARRGRSKRVETEATATPDYIPHGVAQTQYYDTANSNDSYITGAGSYFEPTSTQETRVEHEHNLPREIIYPNHYPQGYYTPEFNVYTPSLTESSDSTPSPVEHTPQIFFSDIRALSDTASQAKLQTDSYNYVYFHPEDVELNAGQNALDMRLESVQQAAQEYRAPWPPLAPLPTSPVELTFDESLIDPVLRDL